jgi:hypothetical protein
VIDKFFLFAPASAEVVKLAELAAADLAKPVRKERKYARVEPRLIDAGPLAGQMACPMRCRDDPDLIFMRGEMVKYAEVTFDTDTAWPDK